MRTHFFLRSLSPLRTGVILYLSIRSCMLSFRFLFFIFGTDSFSIWISPSPPSLTELSSWFSCCKFSSWFSSSACLNFLKFCSQPGCQEHSRLMSTVNFFTHNVLIRIIFVISEKYYFQTGYF